MTEEKWIKEKGIDFLEKIGINEGMDILDFGARNGNYSIPAAKCIGDGKVYALDKDSDSLSELEERAEEEGVDNIETINTSGEIDIPLKKDSIDIVLLYDVIHLVGEDDNSTIKDREKLYKEVYRVTKPRALISVYPSHLPSHTDVNSNEEIIKEIEKAGFEFENRMELELIHDHNLTVDEILNFRKTTE